MLSPVEEQDDETHEACPLALLLALGALLTGAPAANPAYGQDARCFPETGFCIAGPIRAYWERNGGLPVFGYPISQQRAETVEGRVVQAQWFERDRLEDHGAVGVLAGRLGDEWLLQTGRVWQLLYPRQSPTPACRFFAETGFNLCEPFLGYWERGGLERFGYPLTPVIEEALDGRVYAVQYFERRRMEYHPEFRGTPSQVLLGLLGSSVYAARGGPSACSTLPPPLRSTWERYAADLGCGEAFGDGRLAWQPFEGGQMLGVGRGDGGPGLIFVINGRSLYGPVWELYADSYVEGEPVGTDELPPPGKYAPVRGFGKLWRANPQLRELLGWAVAPEEADAGVSARFSGPQGLSWLVGRQGSQSVYVLRAGQPAVALEVGWRP